jgi:hypothetical protein
VSAVATAAANQAASGGLQKGCRGAAGIIMVRALGGNAGYAAHCWGKSPAHSVVPLKVPCQSRCPLQTAYWDPLSISSEASASSRSPVTKYLVPKRPSVVAAHSPSHRETAQDVHMR